MAAAFFNKLNLLFSLFLKYILRKKRHTEYMQYQNLIGEKMNLVKKHPILSLIAASLVLGVVISISHINPLSAGPGDLFDAIGDSIMLSPFVGALLVFPILLMIMEITGLVYESKGSEIKGIRVFDIIVFSVGSIYEWLYLAVQKNLEGYDWQEQLYNGARHTPIYSKASITVFTVFLISIIGYFVLQYVRIEKTPPLVVVFSISAIYLGLIQLIVFTIQVFDISPDQSDRLDLYLLVLPACCILIAARTVLRKIHEWNAMQMEMSKIEEKPILTIAQQIMENAKLWPVLAILLMFPLLGMIIMVLVVFGQAPDSIIKAWTETSDWALSQRQAPPNLYYDEHYLCTVAAGGHRRIVKPLRKGVRHGHEVIVNRQLCIANAFEEVIQEKTPGFHKTVRTFYDKYGFPVAKLIRKKWQADLVYIMMKPLEWIFLLVLYSTDVHPENRIAVQYMGTDAKKRWRMV